MIQSTISDSAHYNSEEQVHTIIEYEELVDALSNPKSDPSSDTKVSTNTTNIKFPQKLLKNWFIPKIIQCAIRPTDHLVMEKVLVIRETLGERQTVLLKEIVKDAARNGAHISGLRGR